MKKNNLARTLLIFIIAFFTIIMVILFYAVMMPKIEINLYLKKMKYDDEFSNIEFVEKKDYKERVAHWWGDGGTSLKKLGTYTRYKVYAKEANINFFVQYRSDLNSFEDNYLVTKHQKEIYNEALIICRRNLKDNINLYYDTFLAKDEVGVFEHSVPSLIVDMDNPINEVCSKEFAEKLKSIEDELFNFLNQKQYCKEYHYWFFNFNMISDDYMIKFSTNYTNDGLYIYPTLYIKGKNDEENNKYITEFKENNRYSNAEGYIVNWDFK